jgi:hypothetical protein
MWAMPDCGILKRRGERPEKYLMNGHTRLIDHCFTILQFPLYDDISTPSKPVSRLAFQQGPKFLPQARGIAAASGRRKQAVPRPRGSANEHAQERAVLVADDSGFAATGTFQNIHSEWPATGAQPVPVAGAARRAVIAAQEVHRLAGRGQDGPVAVIRTPGRAPQPSASSRNASNPCRPMRSRLP